MIEAPPDDSRAELIQGYFNPTAFTIPATGTLGNTPRNFLIGPGSKNVDLSLFRTFTVREGLNVQFRMEAFNAFNFVNLGNPRSNIGAANPGRIDTAGEAGHAGRVQSDVLNASRLAARQVD